MTKRRQQESDGCRSRTRQLKPVHRRGIYVTKQKGLRLESVDELAMTSHGNIRGQACSIYARIDPMRLNSTSLDKTLGPRS